MPDPRSLPDQAEPVERCAACNGPIYYPSDDARPYCHRVKMPAVVVRSLTSDESQRGMKGS